MTKKFYKAIIFCSNPLAGYYKFEDKFQIYPLQSTNAPTHDKVKMYPVVIEYWIELGCNIDVPAELSDIRHILSEQTNTQNYQREIRNLLSAVTNYWFYFPPLELRWFIELPSGEISEDINNQKSMVGMTTFAYPEMFQENKISAFTDTQLPTIQFVKHPECFSEIDLDGIQETTFPNYTDAAIHNYFQLDAESRLAVNAAAALICNGVELRTKMKSLSFVSFVSSIETMVNLEFKGIPIENCKECGQQRFKVVKKFKDYLAKYASSDASAKKVIEGIYKLRSAIAHTGLLLLGDHMVDWSNRQGEEWETHLQAMQISRVSLTNWLLMRGQQQSMY